MKRFIMALALICLVPLSANAASVTEQRQSLQKMSQETLARLAKERPDTQRELNDAVGYAVFTSGSLALFYVSGGYGHGIAHDNRTGQDIYMEMAEAGIGLGLGAKDARTVFVFHNADAFHDFTTTGLDLSGKADAAAKVGEKGAAVGGSADILPGVRVYQLTNTGLMAQAMVQGTKYWVDESLNAAPGAMGYNAARPATANHYNQ